MTAQSIYRLLCDAPYCPVSAVVEKIVGVPDGWTRLSSTAHLDGKPAPMYGRGRNRRSVSTWDLGGGGFTLHLCPEHPAAFGDHAPQTRGGARGRGETTQRVSVGCACGWSGGGGVLHLLVVGKRPASTVERAWLAHLPEDLRWYATREPAPHSSPRPAGEALPSPTPIAEEA